MIGDDEQDAGTGSGEGGGFLDLFDMASQFQKSDKPKEDDKLDEWNFQSPNFWTTRAV